MGKILKKTLSASGWLPNYHGAWAMITVPIILGVVLSGFQPVHSLLLVSWWVGYFAFFATGMWLRAHCKATLFPPVKVYGLACIISSILLVLFAPYLLWWIAVYIPLVVFTAWASIHHQDRSLPNDTVTVIAACLTLPIAYDLGINGACFSAVGVGGLWGSSYLANTTCGALSYQLGWYMIWNITLLVFGYFMGTVFYVKTNIRERRSNAYLWLSVIFHCVFTVFAFVVAKQGIVSWIHVFLWIVLTLRSLVVPVYGRKRHWLSAKQIGIGEIIFSVLVFVTLL